MRALWKANKEKLIEKIPLLGLLQSERSILHVLGRMKKNQETGIKELTDFCRERLDALVRDIVICLNSISCMLILEYSVLTII